MAHKLYNPQDITIEKLDENAKLVFQVLLDLNNPDKGFIYRSHLEEYSPGLDRWNQTKIRTSYDEPQACKDRELLKDYVEAKRLVEQNRSYEIIKSDYIGDYTRVLTLKMPADQSDPEKGLKYGTLAQQRSTLDEWTDAEKVRHPSRDKAEKSHDEITKKYEELEKERELARQYALEMQRELEKQQELEMLLLLRDRERSRDRGRDYDFDR